MIFDLKTGWDVFYLDLLKSRLVGLPDRRLNLPGGSGEVSRLYKSELHSPP